jgi:hypothetical protein
MPELNCTECAELAPELALNALTGRERATALAHLDHCSRCRTTVSALTSTADEIFSLLPDVEPPYGFEKRVLDALSPPAPRSSRWPVAAAASGLALTLIGVGWLGGSFMPAKMYADQGGEPGTRTVLYAPLTNKSQEVGQAYLEPDQPSWVYLSLSANVQPGTNLRCTITDPDSATAAALATFTLDHGHGGWTIPVALQHDGKIVATVIDGAGRVIGSAHFTSPISQAPNTPAPTTGATSDSAHHETSHHKHKHHHHHSDNENRHKHK